MAVNLLTIEVGFEQDVVLARQWARRVAALLGFDPQDQARIATSVSEIARNALQYGSGTVEFGLEGKTEPQLFEIVVSHTDRRLSDRGEVPDGRVPSPGDVAADLGGVRRLMDRFHVESEPAACTRVRMAKILPRHSPLITPEKLERIRSLVGMKEPEDPYTEIRKQNQELLRTLEELRKRQDELTRVNQELEDTNRGVVALYAELDEKADYLRRADEMKSRFLSNMTHEFRTPLNSILALSHLLKERIDGDLTTEQEKQVVLIQMAAQNLSELVNDLLDLAKIEAGKTQIRPAEFQVSSLFSAIRGMLRPLLLNQQVNLVIEEPEAIPPVFGDEGKISQILRNFISNALKFTEHGEVRVTARLDSAHEQVIFAVADTGIGIAPQDQEVIFQEFTQLESPLQKKVKGTGLGLPLSRKLAQMLGGRISVESEPGRGSTFSVTIPLTYSPALAEPPMTAMKQDESWTPDPLRTPILVVEDNQETMFLYEKLLKGSGYQIIPARSIRQAWEGLKKGPKAVILDILLAGEDTWRFLAQLKADLLTRALPVLVVTAVDDREKGLALGADAYCVKPVERRWLIEHLKRLTGTGQEKILLVDDDDMSRYIVKQILRDTRFTLIEAAGGQDGIELARTERPRSIVLDLVMPGLPGEKVLEILREDLATRDIPVIIFTSKVLSEAERQRLESLSSTIVEKGELSNEKLYTTIREKLGHASSVAT